MSRLALGTAQFGFDYGVANRGGRIPPEEAARIVSIATENGIRTYDTSPAYGSSEEVLGVLLPRGSRVVTKVPRIQESAIGRRSLDACEAAFANSLRSLRARSLHGLIVHWADDLLKEGSEDLFAWMRGLKEDGKVGRIGVSVYDAGQLERILGRFHVDLVQLPLNAVDQRFLRSGHLAMLKDRGVEIHVRSVFLQGLLLMGVEALPSYFGPYRSVLERFHRTAAREGISPLELSLGFVLGNPEVDQVLVGVDGSAHLEEILEASRSGLRADALTELACADAGLVNPSLWKV